MKTKIVLTSIVVLFGIVAVFFFRPPEIVVVGFESELEKAGKRVLFEKFRHEVDYPGAASNVCFRLEPGFFKDGEVYGEYVRFSASTNVIRQFIEREFPGKEPTDTPLPYSRWHFGVGDYDWWQPTKIEEPAYYEDERKFLTVDWKNGVVFYSFVRSYSRLGAKGYGI